MALRSHFGSRHWPEGAQEGWLISPLLSSCHGSRHHGPGLSLSWAFRPRALPKGDDDAGNRHGTDARGVSVSERMSRSPSERPLRRWKPTMLPHFVQGIHGKQFGGAAAGQAAFQFVFWSSSWRERGTTLRSSR